MKIQCEVCEKAEAVVLCCVDEAVLCSKCDDKIHAANKLSQKHQRVSLLKQNTASSSSSPTSSQLPLCDICQERNGYFFCLEDRAILCRQCDMSIHRGNPFLSSHQRFLIGGIKVSLESSTNNIESTCMPGGFSTATATGEESRQAISNIDVGANFTETATSGSCSGSAPNLATAASSWQLDDILGTNDFNYYEFSDMESSRIN
ncbi:Zinc finger, B-box [Melia azedarach]|uniref:Zinc finger, B-box n=1 Tax=Melia azedarach TaxID=155640 RepID=A0ACC1XRI2_MELAZ|nr:Zinc finger, B-box [Melia azedarach]